MHAAEAQSGEVQLGLRCAVRAALGMLALGGLSVLATNAHAEEKQYGIEQMTCQELATLPAQDQTGFVLFVEGHERARRAVSELGDLELGRAPEALRTECAKQPQAVAKSLLLKSLPAGRKRIRPGAITCQQFMALPASEQREIAAFADGYYDGNRAKPELFYEADYEEDVAEVLEPCQASPSASFWTTMQDFFRSEDEEE